MNQCGTISATLGKMRQNWITTSRGMMRLFVILAKALSQNMINTMNDGDETDEMVGI
jgi:hypothetical protein